MKGPELAVESAITEVAIMKSQDASLTHYAELLLYDGYTMKEVLDTARSDNYFPGYSRQKLQILVDEKAIQIVRDRRNQ